jgi:hypothetical protein
MCLSLAGFALSAEIPSKAVTIWYKPGGSWIPALPVASGLPPVAVYLFRDSRQSSCGPDCIPYLFPDVGMSEWLMMLVRTLVRTSEPVVLPVTRAFAEGLHARGFPVVDRTRRTFQAGDSTDAAKRGLRGELLRFASLPFKYAFPRMDPGRIVCVVNLEVFDLQSDEKLWEKTYAGTSWIDDASKRDTRVGSEGERIQPFLAAALAAAIENAAMDPELAEALGRSNSNS